MSLPLQRGGTPTDRLLRYAQDTYGLASKVGGQVFFIDGTDGSDDADNPGTTPFSPLLTVKQALSKCTDNHGDIIHIIKNSPSNPPDTEDFPIVIDKANVVIRGGFVYGMATDSGIGSEDQDTACFQIKANWVTIEDLFLGVDSLTTAAPIIEQYGTTSYFGTTIRRCTFDTQNSGFPYSIYFDNDMPYLLVEDCVFGRGDVAGNVTACISLTSSTAGAIRNNTFFQTSGGVGVLALSSCANLSVIRNIFRCRDAANGEAITFQASSNNNLIVDNIAASGFVQSGWDYNPYKDLSTNTTNGWAKNYRGNAIIEPVGY